MISLPIFIGGSLRASLDTAKVEKDINVARYEGAIQSAFSCPTITSTSGSSRRWRLSVEAVLSVVDCAQDALTIKPDSQPRHNKHDSDDFIE